MIWVNNNNSLTWIKAILGMISLINHDFQWGRSEVVIIYPNMMSWRKVSNTFLDTLQEDDLNHL